VLPLVYPISYQDPVIIFQRFALEPWALFLDSATAGQYVGQNSYSFIAIRPFMTMIIKNRHVEIEQQGETTRRMLEENETPFELIYEIAKAFPLNKVEDIPLPDAKEEDFDDAAVGFYDMVIAFNHDQKTAYIFSSGYPEEEVNKRKKNAQAKAESLIKEITNSAASQIDIAQICFLKDLKIQVRSNFTENSYCAAVEMVKEHIRAGDIFEANISQRFSADFSSCQRINSQSSWSQLLLPLYLRLRRNNPESFAGFFSYQDVAILSASPERFLKIDNGDIETRPIKGTCKRHIDPIIDEIHAKQLASCEKNRAENIMIVDLLRNDLSKHCEPHSIDVPVLCQVETKSNVHHLVSVIKGKIQSRYSSIDVMKACFPGGSITGAPKIEAMRIIQAIEKIPRGPYCGCLFYIGFNGDSDSSILIRSLFIKNNQLSFSAGGAVTLYSNPLEEYQETLLKAEALFCSLDS